LPIRQFDGQIRLTEQFAAAIEVFYEFTVCSAVVT